MSGYHVEVFKDSKGEWRWTTIASNGERIAGSSEGYVNKAHAVEQAKSLNPQIEVRVQE